MNKAKKNKANPTKSREPTYAKSKKIWDEKGRITTKEAAEIFMDTHAEDLDKLRE